MSEQSALIRERLAEKRQDQLSAALVRSAALGIALKGNTTPWLAERLSDEQFQEAQSIADEHRLHLEALRSENAEKYGTATVDEYSDNVEDTETAA